MNNLKMTLPFEPWMGASGLGMRGNEKAVFAAVWEVAKDGPREIGLLTISQRTGLSVPTVMKYIDALIEKGFITVERPRLGCRPNKYAIPENIKQGADNHGAFI